MIVALFAPTAHGTEYVYEKVSPADKGNGEVAGGGANVGFRVSENGDHALYVSDGVFAGQVSPGLNHYYYAHRQPTAWENRALTGVLPYFFPADYFMPTAAQPAGMYPDNFSSDGRRMLVGTNVDPETGEIVPNRFYLVDMAAGTAVRATPPVVAGSESVSLTQYSVAGNRDFSTVVWSSSAQLTATGSAPGVSASAAKLYRLRNGSVELASYTTGGAPSRGLIASAAFDPQPQHAVSVDGAVIWFVPGTSGSGANQIHRADGDLQAPVFVNASENTGSVVPPGPAVFRGAAADGQRAVFTSAQRLVDDVDQAAAGTNVYVYDHSLDPDADENLTLISRDDEPADGTDVHVSKVIGVSDDVRTIYFATSGQQLVPGETTAAGTKLYRWHDGALEFLAVVDIPGGGQDFTGTTPDGRYLLFRSNTPLTSDDNGGLLQAYVYDASTGAFDCASCRAGGAASQSAATFGTTISNNRIGRMPRRWLAGDGRAFFLTNDGLLPADINGRSDLYAWKDGALQLVSTGRATEDVRFADASLDGQTVGFVTYERLTASDVDEKADLYVARVGGGMPEPRVPPQDLCVADACQGQVTVAPPPLGPGTSRGESPGNPDVRRTGMFAVRRVGRPRGSVVALRVRVPGAGRLRASGPRVANRGMPVSRAGLVRLRVRLTRGAQRVLQRRGRVRVGVAVRFMAASGGRRVARLRLTLRAPNVGKARRGAQASGAGLEMDR